MCEEWHLSPRPRPGTKQEKRQRNRARSRPQRTKSTSSAGPDKLFREKPATKSSLVCVAVCHMLTGRKLRRLLPHRRLYLNYIPTNSSHHRGQDIALWAEISHSCHSPANTEDSGRHTTRWLCDCTPTPGKGDLFIWRLTMYEAHFQERNFWDIHN